MSGTVTGRWSNQRPHFQELEPRAQMPRDSPFFNFDFSAIEERVIAHHLNNKGDYHETIKKAIVDGDSGVSC